MDQGCFKNDLVEYKSSDSISAIVYNSAGKSIIVSHIQIKGGRLEVGATIDFEKELLFQIPDFDHGKSQSKEEMTPEDESNFLLFKL